jgi:hypothetical protein
MSRQNATAGAPAEPQQQQRQRQQAQPIRKLQPTFSKHQQHGFCLLSRNKSFISD